MKLLAITCFVIPSIYNLFGQRKDAKHRNGIAALFWGQLHEEMQGWAVWVGDLGAYLGHYLAFKGLKEVGTPAFKKGACT